MFSVSHCMVKTLTNFVRILYSRILPHVCLSFHNYTKSRRTCLVFDYKPTYHKRFNNASFYLTLLLEISATAWDLHVQPVGCYRDSYVIPRPLPEMIGNFESSFDPSNPNKTIMACARVAKERGYNFFGLQNKAECRSGNGTERTFGRDGPSLDCTQGVGESGANFVYKFKGGGEIFFINIDSTCVLVANLKPLKWALHHNCSGYFPLNLP